MGIQSSQFETGKICGNFHFFDDISIIWTAGALSGTVGEQVFVDETTVKVTFRGVPLQEQLTVADMDGLWQPGRRRGI